MPKTQSHRMSLVAHLTTMGSDHLDFWLVGLIRFISNRATYKRLSGKVHPHPGTRSHPMGEGRGEGHLHPKLLTL
jgi:hypothetical protein